MLTVYAQFKKTLVKNFSTFKKNTCSDVMQISCYDTAGSVLLLGCTNGSIYYFDMQKFPLRMKDNDLLITELYKDPNADIITAISVYLTPKTSEIVKFFKI